MADQELRSLYEITGDIKDINTMLVQRDLPEKAEKDAERLDWIQRNLFGHKWNGVIDAGSRVHWQVWIGYRNVTQHMIGNTFREAIDAAMEASK